MVVSQGYTDVLKTDFLYGDTELRKAKSYFNGFVSVWSKSGCGLSDHGTLKYAVSQEWIYELGCLFACWW